MYVHYTILSTWLWFQIYQNKLPRVKTIPDIIFFFNHLRLVPKGYRADVRMTDWWVPEAAAAVCSSTGSQATTNRPPTTTVTSGSLAGFRKPATCHLVAVGWGLFIHSTHTHTFPWTMKHPRQGCSPRLRGFWCNRVPHSCADSCSLLHTTLL